MKIKSLLMCAVSLFMASAAFNACEKVDDQMTEKPQEIEKPHLYLKQGDINNSGVSCAIYDAKYKGVFELNIFTKEVKRVDDITIEPQGFNVKYEITPVKFAYDKPGFMVIFSGATGMEPGKEYNIKITAKNEAGSCTENFPLRLAYIENPFVDGIAKIDERKYVWNNEFTGEWIKAEELYKRIDGNLAFHVELLTPKEEAFLRPITNNDHLDYYDKSYYPLMEHCTEGFRVFVPKNKTAEPKYVKVRITDVNNVISYEGLLEYPRIDGFTIEEEMAHELMAMRALRDALGMKDLPWFGDDVPLSEWPGVFFAEHPQGGSFVLEIEWRGPDLNGYIPDEVRYLDHCRRFHLYGGHRVSGTIPEGMGDMKELKDLYIYDNVEGYGIEGRLEDCSLKNIIKQMKDINLGGNNLTGPIPEWLGDRPDYCGLVLHGNRLEGKVPEKVAKHPDWRGYMQNLENVTVLEYQMQQQPGYILYL